MSETVVTGSDRNKVILKMLRTLVLCVAVLSLRTHAQPVSCTEDVQCHDGYYCETDAHICRECLSCEDLKREPPRAINTCIKSVAECGACINELVVDRRGDVNAECVPPSPSPPETTPYYVWVLIGIGVLLFLGLGFVIIVYLHRNPEIFKNAGSNQSSTVTARITATAPEAPPPYNPLPQSLYQSPPYTDVEPTAYSEEEHFIKQPLSRPQGARQADGNQAANPYNRPIYEREPGAEYPVLENPEPPIHDEDTMPSAWMPGGNTSNGDVNANVVNDNNGNALAPEGASVALPALLAAARDTTLVEHSQPKKRCVRQDSRESNYGDSSNSSFPRSPSPSAGGPPYSFITQITNVVQINTNK
ncbi:hypothetical protein PYW07_015916 [Mythimna separata]|uniref:TNFR-Cys domain-containing protein n=1 Tax=Mythimna separata TaxID=271217 RepID=A0AAD7YQZ1_MYTSE|nr:hypothetical protein PYW07_015916 [Mythimna separata]